MARRKSEKASSNPLSRSAQDEIEAFEGLDPLAQARARITQRIEIVESLVLGLDRWDEVSPIVGRSVDSASAREAICDALGVSEIAAHYILDTTLGRRTESARKEYEDELDRLRKELKAFDRRSDDS